VPGYCSPSTSRSRIRRLGSRSGCSCKNRASQTKKSIYLLPDAPAQYELLQSLAKQVTDYGGDSTLIRAQEIERLPDTEIVALFNGARDDDYTALAEAACKTSPPRGAGNDKQVSRSQINARFRVIREIDFFAAPKANVVESVVARASSPASSGAGLWVTRPRPEIDRVSQEHVFVLLDQHESK
jgi:hypothetical protein